MAISFERTSTPYTSQTFEDSPPIPKEPLPLSTQAPQPLNPKFPIFPA